MQPVHPARERSSSSPWLTKAAVVGADLAALAMAMGLALATSRAVGVRATAEQERITGQLALLALPVWVFALAQVKGYQARSVARRSEEFRRLLTAGALGSASLLVISDLWRRIDIQRDFVGLAFLFGVALLLVEREIVRQSFAALRRRGHRLRAVAIVGDNAEGDELRRMFDTSPELGYEFAGFITVEPGRRFARPGEVLGRIDDAVDALTRHDVGSVMIAASAVDVAHTSSLVRKLLNAGINVELSPTLPDIAVERLSIRPLGRFPVMYLQPFRQAGWRMAAKRGFDTMAAFIGLVTLALPLLAVCVAIRLDSKGPVFYRQQRVGRNGRLFDVLKFRTMVPNAHQMRQELAAQNEADGPLFKIKNDPRITRIGRLLRKTSVDELPQLWNVLRGEMSLVGPRPALPEEAALWSEDLRDRLRVQPGITGMWQVSGRSSTSFEEYSRLDLYYVDNWSLLTDLTILGKTLPSVLLQRGAS
ncbi:MAG: sugar transferase [Acidimicrobiia bacterium]